MNIKVGILVKKPPYIHVGVFLQLVVLNGGFRTTVLLGPEEEAWKINSDYTTFEPSAARSRFNPWSPLKSNGFIPVMDCYIHLHRIT